MSYKEKIDDIISHRKGIGIYADCGHLKFVKEKLEFYKGLLKELEDFEMFRNHIIYLIDFYPILSTSKYTIFNAPAFLMSIP